jgi:hypothetical protein
MLAAASSASAQDMSALSNVSAAVKAVDVSVAAKPLGTAAAQVATAVARPAVAATTAISTVTGAVLQTQPAQSVTLSLAPQSFSTQAAWLYKNGWPLYALVDKFATSAQLDQQTSCLATAVYFEARGESLEGQLATRPTGAASSSSRLSSPSFATANFRRRTRIAMRGARQRRLRSSQPRTLSRASARTCCGITPITSLRRGGVTSRKSSRSARTSSIARKRFNS